jgi:lysozyme
MGAKKTMYQLSQKGIDLIRQFEGFKLVPYNDSAGFATVGMGHLIAKRPVDPNIDKPITVEQAYDLFRRDAAVEITVVNRLIKQHINQNQFDALVSFSFNVGIGRFGRGPIPNLINTGHIDLVPAEILTHVKDVKGNVLAGLLRRRQAEVSLFTQL